MVARSSNRPPRDRARSLWYLAQYRARYGFCRAWVEVVPAIWLAGRLKPTRDLPVYAPLLTQLTVYQKFDFALVGVVAQQ
ncbi:hypothetical protein BLAT2472_10927 [Burkholderia latens]